MPKAFLTPELQAFMVAVGADLRRMREAADLTLDQVGDMLDINKDAVSKLERGINTLSMYNYLKIMRFLDMNNTHPSRVLGIRYGLHK